MIRRIFRDFTIKLILPKIAICISVMRSHSFCLNASQARDDDKVSLMNVLPWFPVESTMHEVWDNTPDNLLAEWLSETADKVCCVNTSVY